MEQGYKLVLIATAVALYLPGNQIPARLQSASMAQRADPGTLGRCPPKQELDQALAKVSSLLQQKQYQGALEALEKFSGTKCDARIYLLLAAAQEARGDSAKAEDTLQRAHSIWPLNNSVSASLARDYLNAGRVDNAVQALGDFQVTATTPLQEMQLGVVVYLAAHRLIPALALAETAYKSYPSLD